MKKKIEQLLQKGMLKEAISVLLEEIEKLEARVFSLERMAGKRP